jgi:hypothetical protein
VSNLLGELGGIAGNTVGETIAFAAGSAGRETLSPISEAIAQKAWAVAPIRLPAAQLLALGVAQGQVDPAEAATWAKAQGIDQERFDAMVSIANVGPAIGMAFEAWRRGELTDAEFDTALLRAAIEEQWWPAIKSLKEERLAPAEIAKAIHRGIMPADGELVAVPSAAPGKVPIIPQSPLDPVSEAAAAGLDKERLRVLTANAGLPPGVVQGLQLLNRGAITEDDFSRLVGESNMRNEWGEALLALRRRLLTPHDYVEARVRAWIDTPAMHEGAALSGMTSDDADLLFKIMGRPLSWRQVWIGLARGGSYDGPTGEIDPAFLKALEESNIRPEWYALAWAQRYSYPSAFVLRSMAQAGELTQAEVEKILLYEGWEPTLAKTVSTRWSGSTAGGGKQATVAQLETEYEAGYLTEQQFRAALDALGYAKAAQDHIVALGDARRARKYREQVVTAVAKAYTTFAIGDAQAETELVSVNITGDTAAELLALWKLERLSTIANLNATQIQKAHAAGLVSTADATTQLENLHYTAAEAAELLGP